MCQSAGPAGYHPPLARSPLFQGKRALLRCNIVPISRTRRLSPTASAVPPLSEKEGFYVHHPLPSFMSNSLRGCTFPSLLPCGRRGTACGGGWRTWWLVRVPCMLACALRCGVLPISQTRRLSPTANAVPSLSEKEGFPSLHCSANQLWCFAAFLLRKKIRALLLERSY